MYSQKEMDYATKACCPATRRPDYSPPPARYNVGGLSLSNPMHPPFTDPLYAPYEFKDRVGPFSCNVSKYKYLPPYPIIDPARVRVGEGIRFRSQFEGICPKGYVMGPNNMCFARDEPIGRFYDPSMYMRFPALLGWQNTAVDVIDETDPRAW